MTEQTNDASVSTTPATASKAWYGSKTLWFNFLVLVAGLATTASPALEGHLSDEGYAVLVAAVALTNAVLRLLTHQPIQGVRDE